MFPERVVSEAGRVTLTEASRGFDRAQTTRDDPATRYRIGHGDTSGGHVDVVTRALRPLTSEQRGRLAERGDLLALAASQLPRDEFARTVRAEVRRIEADDGIDRLQRQRRATSLRTWVDRDTGMWCLKGEFDPETGALLDGRLRSTVQALFHDRQPDTCPTDPLLKQHHLRALALVELSTGSGSSGRIDISVLIDADTLLHGEHPDSVIDYGLPIELPIDTLRRWACMADITPIIVAADGVSLYLGRTSRTANRAQRRALRAMYHHCAIPGCRAVFDNCAIHHLRWFRHLGRYRHRQPPAVVQQTPSLRPRRRLEARARRAPKPHHHIPRRSHHDHRATLGVGPLSPGPKSASDDLGVLDRRIRFAGTWGRGPSSS